MPKPSFWLRFIAILKRIFQPRPHQASIYRWLTLTMTLVVVVAVVFGGLPALGVIWTQIDDQLQSRVSAAQSTTLGLYSAEQRNLLQLAQLVSARPTLCALLKRDDIQNVPAYLEELRQDTAADALIVITADGETMVSGSAALPLPEAFLVHRLQPFVDYIVFENPSRLAIFAMSEVDSINGCQNGSTGHVIVLRILDNDFMKLLAKDIGLEQSIIIDDRGVATSFANHPDQLLNPAAAAQVLHSKEAYCSTSNGRGELYFLCLAPLMNSQGQVVALSEVALPADSIRRGAWESVGFLLGIGVLVTLCGSVLAFLITRRITSPLRTLAAAAERMGAGDLETPIPISSGWIAIDRLANQLERSRKSLRQTHLIARRELRRVVHLLGATREGVVTINMDGIVTWANEDACQILGYKISKLLRQPCLQIFRPASDGAVTVSELLQPPPGQLPPTRLAIIDGRGNSIALAITCALLDTEDVNTALRREYALILRDVSEEQAINRLRTEFLATVAHEFRTPLSTIFASTELLVDEGHDMSPDELSNLAHTIHMTTVHLQTLVDNLLESAIIEAGFFRLRYRPLQLPDILNNVVEMISPLLQRRQQHLEVDAPQDLSHFWGDVNRIKQALINLVENASKFSPGGVAITLRVQPVTDALKFEVLDKGSGLPTEQFSGLFERYVTGDHPSGGQYGIGLGLPIVKAIAEAHGGQVGAENRPGGGARVWFTIPLKQKDAGGEEKK